MDKEKEKDTKKKSTTAVARAKAQANQPKKSGGIREYFKGVKIEIKKVVWPTKKELAAYTVIVLFTCVIFALGIWGVDSGILAAMKAVVGISF